MNMTTRQRFQALMHFQPVDRLPIVEWAGWWDQTLQRWRNEGLPGNVDVSRHLGLDNYWQTWFFPRASSCPPPAHHGAALVSTMDDYERLKPHLYPWPIVDPARWQKMAAEQERGDVVIWFTLEGFFWFPRTLLGIEQHLYAFYDEPELMHRINEDLAAYQLRIISEVCRYCRPDFMTFGEDMSYNHGPMLSRKLFDEFLKPYYLKVIPRLKDHGILSIIDSDGDVTEPAYWFEEAGLQGILPLERQAGVDIARLRREHPTMRFIGHFDKMVMNKGEQAMRAEFERLVPVAVQGGFIISCDHQTPPGVSYQDYQLYLRLFWEYAEKVGAMTRQRS